ncbi:MAG: hypothetical protein JKY88_09665 [Pseudomonadales bacterium]|nr:hypothetical protein [Pseudomonadales bacterium]
MDSASSSISVPGESDADWCQVKETLTMLYLSSAQIESSMHEDTGVFQQLSDAMVSIAAASLSIEANLSQIVPTGNNTLLEELRSSAAEINQQVNLSITACQFHDRNTQRLEHVTSALSKVCHILSSPEKYHSQDNWQLLQSQIKDSYTMGTERLMFEHIMMGASVEEALEIYHHNFNQKEQQDDTGDDIELF